MNARESLLEAATYIARKLESRTRGLDLSDRKQVVEVWGALHGLVGIYAYFSGTQPHNPSLVRNKAFMPPTVATEAETAWWNDATGAVQSTVIRQALAKVDPKLVAAIKIHKIK